MLTLSDSLLQAACLDQAQWQYKAGHRCCGGLAVSWLSARCTQSLMGYAPLGEWGCCKTCKSQQIAAPVRDSPRRVAALHFSWKQCHAVRKPPCPFTMCRLVSGRGLQSTLCWLCQTVCCKRHALISHGGHKGTSPQADMTTAVLRTGGPLPTPTQCMRGWLGALIARCICTPVMSYAVTSYSRYMLCREPNPKTKGNTSG